MTVQPVGQAPQKPLPFKTPTMTYNPNDATARNKIRTGNAPDPWAVNRYRRSESGNYEIRNDPNRAINRTDTQNEVDGAFEYDQRQRSILDQLAANESTSLQGSFISAWNAEKDRQEGEYAELFAEAERIGARPFRIANNYPIDESKVGGGAAASGNWAYEQLETSGTGEIRNRIVAAAMGMANNKNLEYSWGGGGSKGPGYGINANGFTAADEFGFDCSGLVQYAYARAGISIGRHSTAQTTAGRIVGLDQLRPGDLVGWGSSPSTSTHVAVYLGNGMIAEFANDRDNGRTRSIRQGWGFDKQAFGIQVIRG